MLYDPANLQALGSFSAATQRLKENKEKLAELGAIICRHGLQDIIGITLLHKHVELKQNEYLVRSYVDHSIRVRPQTIYKRDELVPYVWGAKQVSQPGTWAYYPLQFFRPAEVGLAVKEQAETIMKQTAFLLDMSVKLSELGLLDTFGIALLFNDVNLLGEREVILEGIEYEDRENTSTIARISEYSLEGTNTPTLWSFTIERTINASKLKQIWKFFAH